jgi:MFS family permease
MNENSMPASDPASSHQSTEALSESPLLSLAALLVSVFLLVVGTSLQGILLPIRREIDGYSAEQIALLGSGFSVGFVISCVFLGKLVARVGHIRTFAALAAINGSAALLLLPFSREISWIMLRIIIGFCFGGLIIIIESWLNERSTPERRGAIFSSYMVVSLTASVCGTLSMTFLNPQSDIPFILMVIAVILSIVPVSLTSSPAPAAIAAFTIHPRELFRLSPTSVVGSFMAGLVNGAVGALAAVFGLSAGLSTRQVALLVTAWTIGGAIAYYPIGRLSDRIDRRIMIIGVAAFGILLGLPVALGYNVLSPVGFIFFFGVFGLAQHPLYGVIIAFANDRAQGRAFAKTASELLLTHSVGTILGPIIAAGLMDMFGNRTLFLYTSVVYAMLILFVLWRLRRHADAVSKSDVHPLTTLVTSPEGYVLDPRHQP